MNIDGRFSNPGGNSSVAFRRNDNDRRPARPCLRANDGPGDPKVRARLAEEARQRAERKRFAVDKVKTSAELAREQRDGHRMDILRYVAKSTFGVDQRNMADQLGLNFSYVSKLVLELEATGLVETQVTGRVGRGQSVAVTATDAGEELAEASGQ